MKKKMITIAAVLAMALTLTACSNGSSESGSSDQSSSSSSSSSNSSSSVTESSSAESSSAESSSAESSSVESSSSEDTPSGSDAALNGGRAQKMLDAAKAYTEEWSRMMEDYSSVSQINNVSIQELFDIYFPDLKPDMIDEFACELEMTGQTAQELLIIKPKAGSEDKIKEIVEARFNNIVNNGGFYPAGEEIIAGAVHGVTDDGYYYIVSHHMGKDIAAAMIAAK